MPGTQSSGGAAVIGRRPFRARPIMRFALLLCFPGSVAVSHAQVSAPAEPAQSAPYSEPALPVDPTAPATVGTSAAPSIPLIPSQPQAPLATSPFTSSPAPPSAAAPLPNAGLTDPLGQTTPAPTPTPAATTTTDNIGTARRFQYNFALTLGTTFDDNIFLEPPGSERSDLFFTVQPSVYLGFGGGIGGTASDNYIRFHYSPQGLIYVSHPELDTVQHFVDLSGAYHFSRLTLTGTLGVQILDSTDVGNPHPYGQTTAAGFNDGTSGTSVVNTPSSNVNLDVGRRTRLNIYAASVTGNYYVSDKVSCDVSGQFSISEYAGDLLSSRTLSGSGFFNYAITGKTTLGLGVTAGYVFSDRPNPDQSFEQGNLRVSFTPSSKLIATGQVGLELRQSTADGGSQLSPVFNLSVVYAPFDGTAINLTGDRQVQTSAVLGGQDYRTTTLSLGVSQRFFQRFYVRLNTGYSHSDYVSQLTGVNAGRTDNYYFVQPSLDWNVRDNIVAGIFYTRRSSTSSLSVRDFNDNQFGAHLSVSF